MSLLYFGITVFCLFEARVPEFDSQPLPPAAVEVYTASILGLWLRTSRIHQVQNTTTTSLCWSSNISSLVEVVCCVYGAQCTQGTLGCTQQQSVDRKGDPSWATYGWIRNLQVRIIHISIKWTLQMWVNNATNRYVYSPPGRAAIFLIMWIRNTGNSIFLFFFLLQGKAFLLYYYSI